MRVAAISRFGRRAGGAESYLEQLLPELASRGHELLYLHDLEEPDCCPEIALPPGVRKVSVERIGMVPALDEVRRWRPEVCLINASLPDALEDAVLSMAGSVYFAHDYRGTCISGLKTQCFPQPVPCERTFGPGCLVRYFPCRCGGLNPVSMFRLYSAEAARLRRLHRYRAIITHSGHMQREYLRHGFAPDRVFPFIPPSEVETAPAGRTSADLEGGECRLLFVGRMDRLKGGMLLLDALPAVCTSLGRPVSLVMAGDGPARPQWMARAARISPARVSFTGWQHDAKLEALYDYSHLLVVPSIWPEPFGRVGIEANSRGLPAAAFDVGGIGDWLRDGVNGYKAPGDPAKASGLSAAIVNCLKDPVHYGGLRDGARRMARQFAIGRHADLLEQVLELAAA